MKSARGSGMPSGIARSPANIRAVHAWRGSKRPPVAATKTLATVFSLAVTASRCEVAALVGARSAVGWEASAGGLAAGGGPLSRLAVVVLSGAAVETGSAGFATLLVGGSPVVAVREADRLGNGG